MGCSAEGDEEGSEPSLDEGNRGCSRPSSSTTRRSVSDSSMSRDPPSLSSSLEVASNVEIPIHEGIVLDVTRQVAELSPFQVEEDELIGGDSSVDLVGSPIYDSYSSEEDEMMINNLVPAALGKDGLNSCNLIVAIDFTMSNEWTGKHSFNNRSLHDIGDTPNPYEKVMSIIGTNLSPFIEDNLIPCFGFGDHAIATPYDQEVFSFQKVDSPCQGVEEVVSLYRKIVPNVQLSGRPTSYAPVTEAAIDIVEKSGGKYHVLLIISNSQTTSVNTSDMELNPQAKKTIKSIDDARSYPLSIVLVGVGDGPWDDMTKFKEKLHARKFKNFQFVNFTEIMNESRANEKETAFALAALTGLPQQYKAAMEFGIVGRVTGRGNKINPRPPPDPYTRPLPTEDSNNRSSTIADEQNRMTCPICLTNARDMAFNCGHLTCKECGSKVSNCPICRLPIRSRLRLYNV